MHFSATYQLIENSLFGNLKSFLDKKHIPPCLHMSESVKNLQSHPVWWYMYVVYVYVVGFVSQITTPIP